MHPELQAGGAVVHVVGGVNTAQVGWQLVFPHDENTSLALVHTGARAKKNLESNI